MSNSFWQFSKIPFVCPVTIFGVHETIRINSVSRAFRPAVIRWTACLNFSCTDGAFRRRFTFWVRHRCQVQTQGLDILGNVQPLGLQYRQDSLKFDRSCSGGIGCPARWRNNRSLKSIQTLAARQQGSGHQGQATLHRSSISAKIDTSRAWTFCAKITAGSSVTRFRRMRKSRFRLAASHAAPDPHGGRSWR